MKLLIVIPALNEEQSIESIIQRSLEARAQIIEGSPVTAVDITVVSDARRRGGSPTRTCSGSSMPTAPAIRGSSATCAGRS